MVNSKPVILLIEDEDMIRTNLAELLSWDDYVVSTAENGLRGIQLAMQIQPDLIICDLMLPDVSGYEVLEALHTYQSTSTAPFIFLTALGDQEHIRKGMKLGADDYLVKPFKNSDLLAVIKARLERAKTIQSQYQHKLEMARRSFTQMVAHELRTPLISIVMVQELIAQRVNQMKPEQIAELMQTMESGTRRLRHLVEQIVFLNQLETQLLSDRVIKNDGVKMRAETLLAEVLNTTKQFAPRGRGVEILTEPLVGDYFVLCDTSSLKHALAELVANAVNFSPPKQAVTITQWAQDGWLWIKIVDRGVGIPYEKIKEALQEFQQIDREKQEQQGIGMGLTLANRIITIHRGVLHLHSEEGQGTEVLVQLPLMGNPD